MKQHFDFECCSLGSILRQLATLTSSDTFLGGAFLTDYKIACSQLVPGDSPEALLLLGHLYKMYDILMRIHEGIVPFNNSQGSEYLFSIGSLKRSLPDALECVRNLGLLLEIMKHSSLDIRPYLQEPTRVRLDLSFRRFSHTAQKIAGLLRRVIVTPV